MQVCQFYSTCWSHGFFSLLKAPHLHHRCTVADDCEEDEVDVGDEKHTYIQFATMTIMMMVMMMGDGDCDAGGEHDVDDDDHDEDDDCVWWPSRR